MFGLAADVVQGEQEVMVVSQIGRDLHLHLLIKLRGSVFFFLKLNTEFKENTKGINGQLSLTRLTCCGR